MTEREAIAYIEQWDVTEAAKVLKWYEDNELLRPCDCDTMIAIETESLRDENAKLRELARFALHHCNADNPMCDACCDGYDGECELEQRMRELGAEVEQ